MAAFRKSIVGSGDFGNEETRHLSIEIKDIDQTIDNTVNYKRGAVSPERVPNKQRDIEESEAEVEPTKSPKYPAIAFTEPDPKLEALLKSMRNAQDTILGLEGKLEAIKDVDKVIMKQSTARDTLITELRAEIEELREANSEQHDIIIKQIRANYARYHPQSSR